MTIPLLSKLITFSLDGLTYTINFIPECPGPVKLILRLKDASKFRWVEDEDSEDEAEGTVKPTSHLPQVTEEDPDITMVCEATPKNTTAQHFSAKPVELHGVHRDPHSVCLTREKFEEEHGYTWPPAVASGWSLLKYQPLNLMR
ncbi:uncharacterized protein EDB91DRAFT_1085435 [Suillus paluster]|uniref:uncharacterized protein n=1 Tax=Suillus paluster TaxID=48578 RepID=UPI001B865C34|nr:uncharacterized protein EDB91DRAFT_1085435 [Suillus paluster]KAG1730371.1 hypothetical protein EDB91DRAFT_1085435 [Suillus paluster]